MFEIFNSRRNPPRLATIYAACVTCQEQTAHDVHSRGMLFFTTFRTTCTECATSTTVSAEQADRLLVNATHSKPATAPQVSVTERSAAA